LFSVLPASAQVAASADNVAKVGEAAGINTTVDLPTFIGRIIYIILGFSGVVLLGLLLYAGFLWMTAGGDESKVKQAKAYIQNAVIGLVIVASSFAITAFVLSQLSGITEGGSGTSGPNNSRSV
jgi:phage shock protein PspC (stress-responsive transcriptional regulator)